MMFKCRRCQRRCWEECCEAPRPSWCIDCWRRDLDVDNATVESCSGEEKHDDCIENPLVVEEAEHPYAKTVRFKEEETQNPTRTGEGPPDMQCSQTRCGRCHKKVPVGTRLRKCECCGIYHVRRCCGAPIAQKLCRVCWWQDGAGEGDGLEVERANPFQALDQAATQIGVTPPVAMPRSGGGKP